VNDKKHTIIATRIARNQAIAKHETLHSRLSASRSKPTEKEMVELHKLETQIQAQEKWLRDNDTELPESDHGSGHNT